MPSKMPKIRISEITAFVVFTVTCGFFSAFMFTALLLMSRNLRYFRFIMPDILYDEAGEPRALIAKIFPILIVGAASAVFILLGNIVCGVLLSAAAVIDLAEGRDTCVDFVKKLLRRSERGE